MIDLIKLIRFILGYVTFIIKSPFPERFFNLIAKNDIRFWNVQKSNNEIKAAVILSEYKDIKKIAKKTNTKTRVIYRNGLPFLISKYKNRAGLIIGLLISVIIINIMSSYIWIVEINGNNKINESTINKYVSECEIYQGARIKNIDVSLAEHNIMSKIKDISWISININGSVARVSINERVAPPDIKEEEPCNIVASDDGQIIGIEVLNGKTEIQLGDAVVKGQMLVNGIVPDVFGENRFCHSDGNIYAIVHKNIMHKISLDKKVYIKTGKKAKRSRIEIFDIALPTTIQPIPKENQYLKYKKIDLFKEECNTLEIPIFGDNNNTKIEKHHINTLGYKLPIRFINEEFEEQIEKIIHLNEEEAKSEINNKISEFENNFFKKDIEMISKDINMTTENNEYIANIDYTCKKNIALKEKLKLE